MVMLMVVVFVTLVFGLLRFTLPVEGKINKKDIFKNLAHLWVGGLFGAAIALQTTWELWVLAIGLTVLEVVAFLVRKGESDVN